MMTEHVPISEFRHHSGSLSGKFVLSHVANPNTVQVSILGSYWHIDDFTSFGEPIFLEQQYFKFLMLEKRCYASVSFKNRTRLTASVSYEPIQLATSRAEIDTISGIQASLESMYTYQEMLLKRRCWVKETSSSLNEYIVFGRYVLDAHANVWQIKQTFSVSPKRMVCKRELFERLYGGYIATTSFAFPRNPSDLCPLCGRPFLISDLMRNEIFQHANGCGPAAHSSCLK